MKKYPVKYPSSSEFSAENLQEIMISKTRIGHEKHKAPELGIYKFYELSEPVCVPDYVSLETAEKSAW